MKIAFFTQNIKKGGLDTFIFNLISNTSINSEIILFCNASHPGIDDLEKSLKTDARVSVVTYDFLISQDIKCRFQKFPFFYFYFFKLFFWFLGPVYQFFQILKLYEKYAPDYLMVINGGYPGGDACLMASLAWKVYKPSSLSWHNFHNLVLPYSKNPLKKIKEFVIDYLVMKSVGGFVTVSNACLNTLHLRPIFNKCNKKYIYNGLSFLESPSRLVGDIRTDFSLSPNSKILLMLAVHEPRKGQQFIMDCMGAIVSKCPNTYLFICGDGSSDEVERTIFYKNNSSVCSNIFILEHRSDAINLIKQADVLVMPSQSAESFGYAAVEAMANKKPVVVTNIGGLPEVVENHKTGFVVDVMDKQGFVDCVVELLENELLAEVMGQQGYLTFQSKFSAKRMSKEYLELILQRNI